MNNAEKFYRKQYPKVEELSHLDNEIIRLLNLYKQEQEKKLPIHSVVSSNV